MRFEHSKWICERDQAEAPVFRKRFTVGEVIRATLYICGLGCFEAYINGLPVSEDVFSPALSTYSQLNGRVLTYPLHDIFQSPRVYYCRYDVSALLQPGDNTLSVALGNGWYNQYERQAEGQWAWGCPRLLFEILIEYADGTQVSVVSDSDTKAHQSHILRNNLFYGETQDLARKEPVHQPGYDDRAWENAVLCQAPEGELTEQTCPPDRIIRRIIPSKIGEYDGKDLYDVGENISGYLTFSTGYHGTIQIEFAEELKEGKLDPTSAGSSVADVFYGDGRTHKNVHPHFSWHGFRYFTVSGELSEPVCCVIHTVLPRTSSFHSDAPVLNWLYDAYCRTQQINVHGSIPLDCPHRERLGYTGDGQLCAESCMTVFDAKQVYKKWMQDILDCQGINGHVQHTAPFLGGGGGPSGWGGAVVVVPYMYYWHYGDLEAVRRWYPAIRKYFTYMETRCQDGLVVREEDGGWCLGDWGIPDIRAMDFSPEFVNTCLLVKFYGYLRELEEALEIPTSIDPEILHGHLQAIQKYADKNGDFLQNRHGANAFAGDIGLLSRQAQQRMAAYYDQLGCLDTGIFGTEVLLRYLFQNGYDDLAIRLLTSETPKHSFGYMMRSGATTLWEYLNGGGSHAHPMFGGSVKLLYQYILGIRPTQPGYAQFVVSPTTSRLLRYFEGHMTTAGGEIQVCLRREIQTTITITVSEGAQGELQYGGTTADLHPGTNQFVFDH